MPSAERKALIAASVSPELCKITEDVVLSEPYLEHEHNHWHEGVADLAVSFRTDAELRTEVAELRHLFMTGAQALLHGDLHTGSVMVSIRDGAPVVRVFDPEFSFVGPIGFDLGLYWVNALVSEERARALGGLTDHADQLRLSWKAFESEFRRLWPTRVDTFFDDAYLDRFLRQVWTESPRLRGHRNHPQDHRLRPPDRPDDTGGPGRGVTQSTVHRPRTDSESPGVDRRGVRAGGRTGHVGRAVSTCGSKKGGPSTRSRPSRVTAHFLSSRS